MPKLVFVSNYCAANPSLSVSILTSHTQLFLDSVSFSLDKVEGLLSKLDSDSATGPGGISPCVLKKHCSCSLSLSVQFTLSFSQDHLPSAWKSGNITALHKKGAKTDPCNYRPISLLAIISKVMESIIASDIKSLSFPIINLDSDQVTLYPGYAASVLPTMDGDPQCQT